MNIKVIILYILFNWGGVMNAQVETNHKISSVVTSVSGVQTVLPILDLNSNQILTIAFDELSNEIRDYSYTIVHCNRNWQPSDLTSNEYIDGFETDDITEYHIPTGTKSDYNTYNISLPNDNLSWKISGNYILRVIDDEDNIVLERRFVVVDKRVQLVGTVSRSKQGNLYHTHQDIELFIDNHKFPIARPEQEVSVSILQNGRWDAAMYDLRPKFSLSNQIRFDATQKFSFLGLKDFRNFDSRDIYGANINVNSTSYLNDGWNVLLRLGEIRSHNTYTYEPDQNGAYYLGNHGRQDPEYTHVIFTLKALEPYSQDIHVLGHFNDFVPTILNKMTYIPDKNIYYLDLLLKQGYYDYLILANNEAIQSVEVVEGSSYETQNIYYLFCYYKPIGGLYDQVIGYRLLSSAKD